MIATTIKKLRPNQLFTFKNVDEPTDSQLYTRGEYNRTTKKYECYSYLNVYSFREVKGYKIVYILF